MSIYDDGPAETNRTRAHWARIALEAFGSETGQGDYLDGTLTIDREALTEIGGDLVADLFHLARLNGCTPEALTAAGVMHFEAEVEEEQTEAEENILSRAKTAGITLDPGHIEWTEEGPTLDGMNPDEWLDAMTSETEEAK
ncbi:hypothetical protein G5C51_31625 [Streptomyces sp. A7024]|uniref:Uncharacterized protein n=1 Tax=Streptomyces coryli TaxID=1128680 RepID=A0A6G4U8C1_9ACTN|nr:hypothetical protein [Streptomyces coryli]NGN68434.1 hypothetical protein [Streptomyces coryli]